MGVNCKRDGHVHTHYCPHGSNDKFSEYIESAVSRGIEEITFTEHMPLPKNLKEDQKFLENCAPNIDEFEKYLNELLILQKEHKNKIKINIGIEADYIEGFEQYIKDFFKKYGMYFDDGVLSVHFIKFDEEYICIDCPEDFQKLYDRLKDLDKVYDLYFNSLIKSVNSDLGQYKPKRIGHPTLVRIFNKKYPHEYKNIDKFIEFIDLVNKKGYELDFNTAGLRKEFCSETYPSGRFLDIAKEKDTVFVYGSDAHKAEDVGKDFYNI